MQVICHLQMFVSYNINVRIFANNAGNTLYPFDGNSMESSHTYDESTKSMGVHWEWHKALYPMAPLLNTFYRNFPSGHTIDYMYASILLAYVRKTGIRELLT